MTSSVCPETYDASGDARLPTPITHEEKQKTEVRNSRSKKEKRNHAQQRGGGGLLRRAPAAQRDQRVRLASRHARGALRAGHAERDFLPIDLDRRAAFLRRGQPTCASAVHHTITGLEEGGNGRGDAGAPRVYEPKRDRIRAHAEWAPLLRGCLREADDRSLRRGIVRLSDVPVQARRRGDIRD